MNNIVDVVNPEWFEFDGLVTLPTIINERDTSMGILLAGDNLDGKRPYNPVVRVYLLTLKKDKYEFTKEMSALSFNTEEDAINFVNKFSSYSAVELFVDLYKQQIKIAI